MDTDFAAEAARRGAVACVAAADSTIPGGLPAALVADTIQGLKDFARWYRQRRDALVVGVTGSVGKTTTREMIYAVLRTRFDGCRSPKNYNNHIGLPLSVLDMNDGTTSPCSKWAPRTSARFASWRPSRLRRSASSRASASPPGRIWQPEQIVEAKGELVESLPADGFAVLNGDDPHCRGLGTAGRLPCHDGRPARHKTLFVRRSCARSDQNCGSGRRRHLRGSGRRTASPDGALAAVAVARELGLTTRQIAEGFSQFTPVDGRCHVRDLGQLTLIDDTYNANPISMEAACRLLGEWPPAGGEFSSWATWPNWATSRPTGIEVVGRTAAHMRIDRLAAFGRYAADVIRGAIEQGMTSDQVAECDDLDSLLTVLDCWSEAGDVVLVKGSRSMQMERVSEWLIQQSETNKEIIGPANRTRACA